MKVAKPLDNTKESQYNTAIFAGGCFWCMVQPFDTYPGIISVVSGYTGGHVKNPSYEEVCTGATGHVEAVKITFDPKIISYKKLVDIYWQVTDPTDEWDNSKIVVISTNRLFFIILLSRRKLQKNLKSN